MWARNTEKEFVKDSIDHKLDQLLLDITKLNQQIQESIYEIDVIISGTISGSNAIENSIRHAFAEYSNCVTDIYASKNCINQIQTEEWVNDD